MASLVGYAPRRIGGALSTKSRGIACARRRAPFPFDAYRELGAEAYVGHSSAARPVCGLRTFAQGRVNGIDFTTVSDRSFAPNRGNPERIDPHRPTAPVAEAFSISWPGAASSGSLPEYQFLKPRVDSRLRTASASFGQSPRLSPKLMWLATENRACVHVAGFHGCDSRRHKPYKPDV